MPHCPSAVYQYIPEISHKIENQNCTRPVINLTTEFISDSTPVVMLEIVGCSLLESGMKVVTSTSRLPVPSYNNDPDIKMLKPADYCKLLPQGNWNQLLILGLQRKAPATILNFLLDKKTVSKEPHCHVLNWKINFKRPMIKPSVPHERPYHLKSWPQQTLHKQWLSRKVHKPETQTCLGANQGSQGLLLTYVDLLC